MENKQNKNCCFYCEHLILDGMDSWCDMQHRTGEICDDYKLNNWRFNRVKMHENKSKEREYYNG